jgi:hypothetical protein
VNPARVRLLHAKTSLQPKELTVDHVAAAPEPMPSTASSTSPQPGGAAVVAAYAVTIFSSAFLLFQVQPLISKFILPWFGGSPAVWTAAMLFFQLVLFAGYLYAHLSSTYLSPRGQLALHIGLLVAATALALYTQISPRESLKPTGDEASPLLSILVVLGATVGVPYFALSSTGPLLQKWFSDAFAGASPYRLFALSNVGSLLALVSYPFFFEVYWDSRQQALIWTLGFAVFAGCCAFCAWWTSRARRTQTVNPLAAAAPITPADRPPGFWLRAAWIGLPALASILFLAVTNEVCQNVATVPLLWIIPLSLYLVSFIVAFDHPRWYVRSVCASVAIGLLVFLANYAGFLSQLSRVLNVVLRRSGDQEIDLDSWPLLCGLYFLALLFVCLICHCELARLKPRPRFLTEYFLTMSLGGALGGLFANLVAPQLFTTFFELPLAMLASIVVATLALCGAVRQRGMVALAGVGAAGLAALLAVAYWQVDLRPEDPAAAQITLYRGRNFFGLVRVQERSRHDPQLANFVFHSGQIPHGRQYADPQRRHTTEVAYYGKQTGCGVALDYKLRQSAHCRIGIIGLGVGTIAAYARPGDYVRFYEINPAVLDIAQRYFHYLADCPAPHDVILGDARLKLEQELKQSGGQGNKFDVLVLDAFSGDAIPTHLLTTEAFAIYKQHLAPDGLIVAHITNSYLDLYPVVKRLAAEHHLGITRIYRPRESDSLVERTYYALLTTDEQFLKQTPELLVQMPASFQRERDIPLWTDRYHNLFQILR